MQKEISWDFNIWQYSQSHFTDLTLQFFQPFIDRASLSRENFHAFVKDLQNHYPENPYHNFRHALDVVQFLLVIHAKQLMQAFSSAEAFALLITALSHDVGHPGKNNAYQIAQRTTLYQQFGEDSPLERHHTQVMKQLVEKHDLLSHFSSSEVLWTMMQTWLLSTNMENHHYWMDRLSKKQHLGVLEQGILFLKCADLAQLIRPQEATEKWAMALHKEITAQIDEIACDIREWGLSQLVQNHEQFIKNTAKPLFKLLGQHFPLLSSLDKKIHTQF